MFLLALASIMLSAVATGFGIASKHSAAKSKSQALKQQGKFKAEERAKKTRRLAGSQKASFLHSGIALTGEGTPQSLIEETYDIGLEDMGQIKENTRRGVSNIWGQARAGMISDLGNFALSTGLSVATMGIGAGAKGASDAAYATSQAGKLQGVKDLQVGSSSFFGIGT